MRAQEYILSQLEVLKAPLSFDEKPRNNAEMVDAVFTLLMSKKFRKFSIPEKNQVIIKSAIEKNIANNEPIKIVFPFGGYKLWRFEEAPETDWAELFSMMYFTKWLKSVCSIYPPGVIFTFWFDEVVIGKLNNIPQNDLDAYRESFKKLLGFIGPYVPSNMKFETFLERSRYKNYEAFEGELAVEVENLRQARALDPKPLSDTAIRSIEMNVKLTPDQAKDPEWREKVDLVHYAYYNLQEHNNRVRPAYVTENITAFTYFFEPNVIPIGTTKTSVAKFWVGVGALQTRGDSFIETVLSISQLEKAKSSWEAILIEGLDGKNFKKIRII